MQNFGKFKKITAEKTRKAEQNTTQKRISKAKANAYLVLLAKHKTEVQKIKNDNDRK